MNTMSMIGLLVSQAWIMVYVFSHETLAFIMALAWCFLSIVDSIIEIIRAKRELKYLKKEMMNSLDEMLADIEKMACEEEKKTKKKKETK